MSPPSIRLHHTQNEILVPWPTKTQHDLALACIWELICHTPQALPLGSDLSGLFSIPGCHQAGSFSGPLYLLFFRRGVLFLDPSSGPGLFLWFVSYLKRHLLSGASLTCQATATALCASFVLFPLDHSVPWRVRSCHQIVWLSVFAPPFNLLSDFGRVT